MASKSRSAKLPKMNSKVRVPKGNIPAAAKRRAVSGVKAENPTAQINPITGKTERNITGGYYAHTSLI